jgi:hypothetical protein
MFTNPGRFAGQYRKAYGCSPGGTLRAGPPMSSGPAGSSAPPDLDAALAALRIDPDDPADAGDLDAVAAVWSRRALGPVPGPAATAVRDGSVLRLPARPPR